MSRKINPLTESWGLQEIQWLSQEAKGYLRRVVIRALTSVVIVPDASLPGIVPDEMQAPPPCVTKGIKSNEEYEQGKPWLIA